MTEKPSSDDWFMVVSKGNYEMYLYNSEENATTLGAYFVIGGEEYDLWNVGTTEFNAGEWYHIAVTFNGSAIKGYINGTLDFNYDVQGTIDDSTGNDLLIGRELGSDHYFNGMIDEVEIFNRALEQSEIQSIYNADSAGKCKTPTQPSTPTITDPSDGATLNTGTPTFKGRADAGNTVLLTVASDPHNYSVSADENGDWQFTVPDADKLADGDHTLTVQARDGQGNLSGTRTISFKVSTVSSIPVSGGENLYISLIMFVAFIIAFRFLIAKLYNLKA